MNNINEEQGINTFNEKSLHDDLKKLYNADRYEAKVGRYIIDAIKDDCLIEVQTKNIYAIRKKLKSISREHKVILVHPIIENKYIMTKTLSGETKVRKSPNKGKAVDIFKELVTCFELIEEENLCIHLYLVDVDEQRVDDGNGSYRRNGISVENRTLKKVNNKITINSKQDLVSLLGDIPPNEFTVNDMSIRLNIKNPITQKICYTLKKLNIIKYIGKRGKSYLYEFNSEYL